MAKLHKRGRVATKKARPRAPTRLFAQAPARPTTPHARTHELTHCPAHQLTYPRSHPTAHSLAHSPTHSTSHSRTHLRNRPVAHPHTDLRAPARSAQDSSPDPTRAHGAAEGGAGLPDLCRAGAVMAHVWASQTFGGQPAAGNQPLASMMPDSIICIVAV